MTASAPSARLHAVLIHDAAALAGDAAARDVLQQIRAIETALGEAGASVAILPVDLDFKRFKNRLAGLRPDVVFNLVESLDGSDRLQTLVPLALEDWGIPFTGSGSAAMLLANHKIRAKRLLADHGLPVPASAWRDGTGGFAVFPESAASVPGAWIVKTLEAHASLFLDDDSVILGAARSELEARLAAEEERRGVPFFAESYIDGREFNLSLLDDGKGGVETLPIAEIDFAALPEGRPRIVGYAAKWEEDSPEYRGTGRTFAPRAAADGDLRRRLAALATAVWNLLGLEGYARVDFRVDRDGSPFILEANANPCLSPDAGFAAAAGEAGMNYGEMIGRITAAGKRRRR